MMSRCRVSAQLRAEPLSGLPTGTLLTAEYDPLRDEGEACARRLQEAQVDVTVRRFDGMFHPFIVFGELDDAMVAPAWIGERLRIAPLGDQQRPRATCRAMTVPAPGHGAVESLDPFHRSLRCSQAGSRIHRS